MQNGGTLKKRKKRNIAKVTGLSTIPYDDSADNFDTKQFFTGPGGYRTHDDTRLSMSHFSERARSAGIYPSSASTRPTRNAAFHFEDVDEEYGGTRTNSAGSFEQLSEDILKERPCFIDKTSMTRLRQVLWLGILSGAFPWKWNRTTHQIDRWSPTLESLWKVQWAFVSVQNTCILGYQIYNFVKGIEGDVKEYRGIFMSSFSVLWYIYWITFTINMFYYMEPIRNFVNTLFRCNRELVGKYLIHLDDYVDGGRLVMNLSIPSNCTQVLVSVSLFLRMPFQPWYLFSFIYPKPWYWLIPGAYHEFVVIGQALANYLLYQWIIVAYTISLEFWLTESHNHNDSGYTRETLRRPKAAVETFRILQVLSNCLNDCMAPLAIPFLKLCMFTALIPCGFVFIRSMNHLFIEEFPGILTYPLGIIDCAFAAYVTISLAALVHDLAGGFVDSWSRTKQKDFRRILISCPTLKVKFGRFYVITVSTTIVFFQTVIDYIVDCIITFP